MLYRRFGRTEIQMPVFTCGGMRYQHQWQDLPLDKIPADNQANLEATVRRALELGINHIETARGYGSSERQLGLVLPQLPRDEIIVQTKVAPADDPAEFRAALSTSRSERLQASTTSICWACTASTTTRSCGGRCATAAAWRRRGNSAGRAGCGTSASRPTARPT